MRSRWLLPSVGLLLAGLLQAGCVSGTSSVRQPEKGSTTLMVSRSEEKATLKWKSDPGYLYTVMVAPRRKTGVQWRAHPEFIRVPGTGRMIVLQDRVPHGQSRHYRLHIESVHP